MVTMAMVGITVQREIAMVVVVTINAIIARYSVTVAKDGTTWSMGAQVCH